MTKTTEKIIENLDAVLENLEEEIESLNKNLVASAEYHWEGDYCRQTQYSPAEYPYVVTDDYDKYEEKIGEYFAEAIKNGLGIELKEQDMADLLLALKDKNLVYWEDTYDEAVGDYVLDNYVEEVEPDYDWRED